MSIISVWKRQTRNWKIVSIRSMLSRFFTNLTLAYDSIYIKYLGANPIQLGMVNSISHLAGTLGLDAMGETARRADWRDG